MNDPKPPEASSATELGVPDSAEPSSPPSGRATDSPWFWLGIFLTGALVALVLTEPKFRWRQPQLERQFQARERSGQAVSAYGGPRELSQTGQMMLTLRPLVYFLVALLAGSTISFWFARWHRARRSARHRVM